MVSETVAQVVESKHPDYRRRLRRGAQRLAAVRAVAGAG